MQQLILTILRFKEFFDEFNKDKLRIYSAQASFFVILSFVPFLILLLTLVQFTPLTESQLITMINDLAPSQLRSILTDFIEEMYTSSSLALISTTAIAAIWAASKAFASIMEGFNSIFHVHETRNYMTIRILSVFYTAAFIILIILSLSLLVFGNQLLKVLKHTLPWVYSFLSLILDFKLIYALGILTLFFMFLFKYIPNRKTSLVKELPGALFSAVGWMGFSYIYSLYVDYSDRFSKLYGNLASLAFAMLWLYICMYILFIGAEISKFRAGHVIIPKKDDPD